MDTATIILGVGVLISLVLGVINLFARREKVIIREAKVAVSVVKKPKENQPHLNEIERIFIRNNFKLVRTRGQEDVYIESAYLQLNSTQCEELRAYFRIPSDARFHWEYHSFIDLSEAEHRILKINQPRFFDIYGNLERKSPLQALEKEAQQSQTTEERQKKQDMLNDLKEKVKKLESEYKIVWIDGKGREWQYRLPQKWWNKFLPEWLWWRIG
ncbi:hypothetical protein ES707_02225 [subsurface metagenome]